MSQNSTNATEIATPQSPNYSPQSPDNRPISPINIPDNLELEESKKPMPPYVKSDDESGVEARSLELAQLFMGKHGRLARRCRTRGELSALYLSTQATWMPIDWGSDINEQRLFKQVLFAIAHGMKLVRVVNKGRNLSWNRYRDNQGKPIERPARRDNDHRRDRRDYDRRDRRSHRDTRRSRHRDEDRYDRRDRRSYRDEDRYDRRDRRSYRDEDRRDSRYRHAPDHRPGSHHDCDTAFLEEGPDGKWVLAQDQERAAYEDAKCNWENECRRRRRNDRRRDRRDRDYDRRHPSSYRDEEWCWNDSRKDHNQEKRGEVEAVDLSYER